MILIRAATEADERPLAELDHLTWSPEVSPAPLWDRDEQFFAESAPQDVVVATRINVPVGFVKLRHASDLQSNGHVLEIAGMAVAPSLWRQGIGYRLVTAAAHVAKNRGARRLTLHVLGTNTAALRLYSVCGFCVEGTLAREFLLEGKNVDDVLMALPLTEKWFRRYPSRQDPLQNQT